MKIWSLQYLWFFCSSNNLRLHQLIKWWIYHNCLLHFVGIIVYGHFIRLLPRNKLERVQAAGFQIQRHYITTDDGYILQLYHLPPVPNAINNTNQHKKPLLFMHGLQSSSLDYVCYPNVSIGEYELKFDVNLKCRFTKRQFKSLCIAIQKWKSLTIYSCGFLIKVTQHLNFADSFIILIHLQDFTLDTLFSILLIVYIYQYQYNVNLRLR